MRIHGSYTIDAPAERVWDILLEPESLKASIPGVQSMTETGENAWKIVLTVGIAAFKGTYEGDVRIAGAEPPREYDIHVEGKGRPGWVRGVGHIELVPNATNTQTTVNVAGEASLGGPMFAIGSRFAAPAANLLMGQFFHAMKDRIERSA
jgi:carbon monoxide dehydrogenase subunit G